MDMARQLSVYPGTQALKFTTPRMARTASRKQRPTAGPQPRFSWQAPPKSPAIGAFRQAERGTPAAAIAAAPPSPAPAAPFLDDFPLSAANLVVGVVRAGAFAPPAPPRANDPNHGHTWLTHPCPHNPFRTDRDEEAWYVPPTPAQRRLAQRLGLPLYGIS